MAAAIRQPDSLAPAALPTEPECSGAAIAGRTESRLLFV